MPQPLHPLAETRRDQMFPHLEPEQVARLTRFGERKTFAPGECLVTTGEIAAGVFVILSGSVDVTQQGGRFRTAEPIVTHVPGSFLGELAQLGGRPSLVDACTEKGAEAIVIAPRRLRDLMIEEAELGELIMRALIMRRVSLLETGAGGPVIIGSAEQGDVVRLEGFLARSAHPYLHLDPETDHGGQCLVAQFHIAPEELPIVVCPDGRMLRNPSDDELARCLGLVGPIDPNKIYDVVIVGAGPAGLAAAVYAGSEGLSVLVLDARAFGGQAAASARIENYLGFPTGIKGSELMGRAYTQAQKFGVDMAIPDEVRGLERDGETFVLTLADKETVRAGAVVIASGARYRRLDVDNLGSFEGSSVHYWASPIEGQLCSGQEVALVGAGNSAGQAAVYLSSVAAKVWLIARGQSLESSMSRYLVDRIAAQPNIEVLTDTVVTTLEGADGFLAGIACRSRRSGQEISRAIRHLFLFIGADPNTSWLSSSNITLDGKGFVLTGTNLHRPLETNLPGVFAIGDVRSRSTKRVAAAVGEGAQVVAALHAYLAEVRKEDAINPASGEVNAA